MENEKIEVIKSGNQNYLFITQINNLLIDLKKWNVITIDGVIFVNRKTLPYVRKRLGLKKPFGNMTLLKRMKNDFFDEANVFAVIHHKGETKDLEYSYIKKVRDSLNILVLSEFKYSNRRIVSIPTILGDTDNVSFNYMFINKEDPNTLPGWRRYGTIQPMRINDEWLKWQKNNFFIKLLKIINKEIKVSKSWREQLKNAAILAGKSFSSKDIGNAFMQNMIIIEMLLTRQGDKYTDAIIERIESFIGWVNYWEKDDYEEKIRYIYKLRCLIVHEGKFDLVKIDDLLYSDELVFNILNNIVKNINLFQKKEDVIIFSEKVKAEKLLGINAKTRPSSLSYSHTYYKVKDWKGLI